LVASVVSRSTLVAVGVVGDVDVSTSAHSSFMFLGSARLQRGKNEGRTVQEEFAFVQADSDGFDWCQLWRMRVPLASYPCPL
jgi:hypothetical protein